MRRRRKEGEEGGGGGTRRDGRHLLRASRTRQRRATRGAVRRGRGLRLRRARVSRVCDCFQRGCYEFSHTHEN
eukprot:3548535-Pyramimonas_sp.AAC.1